MPTSASLFARIAAMEIRGRERHWSLMPPELARRLKPRVERVGDGLATLLPKSDSLQMNRVVGLGSRGSVSAATVGELVALYRSARLRRFSVELPAGPRARATEARLVAAGLRTHRSFSLLLRDLSHPIARAPAGVRATRARGAALAEVVDIFRECFGGPVSRRAWALAAATRGRTESFIAWSGPSAMAVGSLLVEDRLGWFNGGATRPRWRHRGAHAALIVARLRRARGLGCRWAWSEASPPAPGRPSGSYRNLLRHGFEPVAEKRVLLWRER